MFEGVKLTGDSAECPHCGACLVGSPVPEKSQHLFGGAKFFSRVIGIEQLEEDFISAYRCPDCGVEDARCLK